MTLLAEIQSACTPQEIASRDHALIAAKVSAGRTMLVRDEITMRGAQGMFPAIAPLPGPLAFMAAVRKLRTWAEASISDPDPVKSLLADSVKLQLAGFQELGLDFSSAALRDMLDLLVGFGAISTAESNGFKALAVRPNPVSPVQVAAALDGAV